MALKDPNSGEWKILFGVSGTIDVAQWVIDFIPAIGEVANEILDPVLGICWGLYFQIRGVSMIQHPSRLVSLVGGYAAEALTASVAPAWVIDVWYIHKTVKDEWVIAQSAKADEEEQEGQPLNRDGIRRPTAPQSALNQNGMRKPARSLPSS